MTHASPILAMDITHVRMYKGWMYLCAVLDWHRRKVLAWRLSNAMARFGTPAVFNTDQGRQFSSETFTSMRKRRGIAQYMTFYNSQLPHQAHLAELYRLLKCRRHSPCNRALQQASVVQTTGTTSRASFA